MAYPRLQPSDGAVRPLTFEAGSFYYQQEFTAGSKSPLYKVVCFIRYDACPAFVIIARGDGSRTRCLREDLWDVPKPVTSGPDTNHKVLGKI